MPEVVTNTTYDPSGFLSTHTISGFNCSDTNSHLIVVGYQRLITTEVTQITANANVMSRFGAAENSNVCGTEFFSYTISNSSFDIVGSTPAFKLLAMSAIGLRNVDQTTPVIGTPVVNTGFSDTMTTTYTGTAGNLLLVAINCQNPRTLTASGCTQIHNFDPTNANLGQVFLGSVVATGSTQTIGATSSSGDNFAISIIEIKSSGGNATSNGFLAWL